MTEAEANHLQWLPGLCGQDVRTCPTPVMQKARDRGYVTYAFDQQSAAYPNFRAQALNVAFAGKDAGLPEAREVDSNPDIWLTMPDDATFIRTCGSGAAGCITYWTDPIMIYFRMALFYTDWRTTIGHEGLGYGHAQGQHERYFDNGEFRCDTAATYTVMSCGTGVWRPQSFDIETVCAALRTSWCGVVAPLCSQGEVIDGLRYDTCLTPPRFVVVASGDSYDPSARVWYDRQGRPEWDECNGDRLRWNRLLEEFFPQGRETGFKPSIGYGWRIAPAC